MTMLKRMVCGMLVGCMVLAAGCSGQDTTWAYQVGEQQLPTGVYVYYQMNGTSNAQQALQDANADNEDYTLPETHEELLKLEIDGQSVEEYITAEAQALVKEHFAIEQEFAARELTLSEDELAYAESTAASAYEQNAELFEDNGISESSLCLIVENDLKRQALFNDLYGEDGEMAADEEELKEYFLTNYAKVDMMLYSVPAEDDTESTNRADAEAFMERMENGEDFYTVFNDVEKAEFDAEQAASTATQIEEYTPVEEGDRAMLFGNSEDYRTSYGDTLIDGVFGAEIGKPVMFEDTMYIYIINRLDLSQSDDFSLYKTQVLYEAKADEFNDWLTEKAESIEMTSNEATLNKFTPSHLKMDVE